MTQQQRFEQIAHERFLELALEGHRFDDIGRDGGFIQTGVVGGKRSECEYRRMKSWIFHSLHL